MKGIYNSLEGLKPIVLMVFVQIVYAAVNIICKLVINDGMSMRVATAYHLTFASAFTIPLALIFDRKLYPQESGLVIIVIAWWIRMRGPLFAAVFNPLQLLLVAIFAYLLVDEKLYLGSVLGAVLLVCGLYIVLWNWSKSKEMEKKTQLSLKTNIELEGEELVMSNPEKCIQSNKTQINNNIQINVTNDQ
ncbi:WAT1-related protein [Trifolium repens]|nr:WAT1-related protein [Trifolium repens]